MNNFEKYKEELTLEQFAAAIEYGDPCLPCPLTDDDGDCWKKQEGQSCANAILDWGNQEAEKPLTAEKLKVCNLNAMRFDDE